MSKENLDSYELFFSEIPRDNVDHLEAIIEQDDAQDEANNIEPSPCLSHEQVDRLADDSRELSESSKVSESDNGDTLFSVI